MAPVQVVLVDHTQEIDLALLHSASLALNNQVTQDLAAHWAGINAAVSYATSLASLPRGAWPVFLVKSLPPGEGGYHLDQHNQPFAKVIASASDASWTIDASHEIIEMLVDPSGNRMQTSQAIKISGHKISDARGTFSYLVEACDPCEANKFAYEIGGIAVSDFITPHFYDASLTPSVRYSFKGNVNRPRQLLPGGYITYREPSGEVQQILWIDPSKPPRYKTLAIGKGCRSLRETVHLEMGESLDGMKHAARRDPKTLPKALADRVAQHRERLAARDREMESATFYGLAKQPTGRRRSRQPI
jgi:hypothetical protein